MTRIHPLSLIFPRPLAIAIAACCLTLPLPACKRSPEGGSKSPAPPAKADGGHDHGHEHGEEHTDEVKLSSDAVGQYGIKVEAAQLWRLQPTFMAPARTAFNTEAMAHVGSPLKGRAVGIKVRLGDLVQAGDELLTVESPELGEAQSEYLARRTAVQTAGPAVELAKAAWERGKGLYEESRSVSLTEVQRREAEYKAAVASLKAAEASVMAAENRLHLLGMNQESVSAFSSTGEIAPRLILRAPIAGQVIEREVTLGELVSPERESLLVVADLSMIWVLADVPETRLREVAKGAKGWIRIGGADGERLEATVSYIPPTIDSATRTAQVRMEAPGSDPALKPGAFAQVEIVATQPGSAEIAPVIAVPEEAVQTVEGGPAVFVPVKGEPNTYAKRAVAVGKPVGGLVPILSGLVEGEEFVSAGTFILKAELGKGSAAHEH